MIITEEGQGLPNAQSYISVDDATAYHASMGNTAWTDYADKQESSLVRATQMIDAVWGRDYMSRKSTKQQRLLFPRLGFYDNNGDYISITEIPNCLKDATAELALEFMTSTTDLLATNADADIKKKTQKIGELSESVEYFGMNTTKQARNKYGKVDLLLSTIVAGPDFSIRL